MDGLDQRKALAMMDLNADATRDEVSKRYGILTRKFRTVKKDEQGNTLEDITAAYNLLMGITFKDEKELQRQKQLRENPPLLARMLKKDPVALENFFHYYKWHMIIALVLVVAVLFTVRSCVNRVETDFLVALSGSVYMEDGTVLEKDILQKLPELNAPQVQLLTVNPTDGEYNYAIQMKLMALLSAAEIDVILMDQDSFALMSSQGMLQPLEEHAASLPFPQEAYVKGSVILEEPVDAEPVLGPETAFAVDITQSEFVAKNQILGEKIFAGIVINSKRMEKAFAFVSKME